MHVLGNVTSQAGVIVSFPLQKETLGFIVLVPKSKVNGTEVDMGRCCLVPHPLTAPFRFEPVWCCRLLWVGGWEAGRLGFPLLQVEQKATCEGSGGDSKAGIGAGLF